MLENRMNIGDLCRLALVNPFDSFAGNTNFGPKLTPKTPRVFTYKILQLDVCDHPANVDQLNGVENRGLFWLPNDPHVQFDRGLPSK
jgi:hypothetical protein